MSLFRPVGQAEYDLIAQSNFTAFPPRLPEQPIFYPVLSERQPGRLQKNGIAAGYLPQLAGSCKNENQDSISGILVKRFLFFHLST